MKKLSFIFIAILYINIANAQWALQKNGSLLPEALEFNSVYFIDANTGYAVGGSADYSLQLQYIFKTTDGGINWIEQTSGTSKHLYSVYFINANTGYAVGLDGIILKTTNGGTNWNVQSIGVPFSLYSVFFTDINTGYAVGGETNLTIQQQYIYKTIDGGINWLSQSTGTQALNSVFFINSNTGFTVGYSGTILKTTNGGANWIAQFSGTNRNLNSVFFIDSNTGFAIGDSGTILKTTNGGTNWISQSIAGNTYLNSVYFTDINTGYVVGGNYNFNTILYKTTDGGDSWVTMPSPLTYPLYSVFFPSASIGYAVGSDLSIIKYDASLKIDKNNSQEEIVIYPIPAKDNLTIEQKNWENFQNATISIYNIQGQLCRQIISNQPKTEIDIKDLSTGLYVVNVCNEKESYVSRFVKE